jgi:hypothetical protein
MYVLGVVVTDADETPTGRASEALRAQLPGLFPEHRFEFLTLRGAAADRKGGGARADFSCARFADLR